MSNVSRITLAFATALILGGALVTFLTLTKRPATIDILSSTQSRLPEKFDVIVGDETPFTPEW